MPSFVLRPFFASLGFALGACSLPAYAQQISDVAWLAGCWRAEQAEAGSVEHWMPPAGGSMLGMARRVKNGKTVEFEFMQIRSNAEGKIVYIALPSGQRETSFTLLRSAPGEAVFENLAHDFPQRVIYRLVANDAMQARIEGMKNGMLRGIDFPMKRLACDPPAK